MAAVILTVSRRARTCPLTCQGSLAKTFWCAVLIDVMLAGLQLDNVMVHGSWPQPLLKLCDFGFSKREAPPEGDVPTACRTTCGTPEYMAPEVCKWLLPGIPSLNPRGCCCAGQRHLQQGSVPQPASKGAIPLRGWLPDGACESDGSSTPLYLLSRSFLASV